MSTVWRNDEKKRPSWNYKGENDERTCDSKQLEMIESARNALEQIRDKQMLQCSVARDIASIARDIASIARELRGLRRDLKKGKVGKP